MAPVGAETNLALGRSYTISPKPNYPLCTDKLDSVQLTDGKASGSSWFRKSTVGWHGIKHAPEITVDLKRLSIIEEIRVHSIGGGAALVEYPALVAVFVADNGTDFRFVGLVDSRDLPRGGQGPSGKVPHTFVIKTRPAKARFVKLLFKPGGSHLYLDEIEVIGFRADKGLRPVSGPVFTDGAEMIKSAERHLGLRDKVESAGKVLTDHKNRFSDETRQSILLRLRRLQEHFAPIDELFSDERFAGIDREVDTVRSLIYNQIYKKPYVCLKANPMDVLKEADMYVVDAAGADKLDITLWQREYESAAINIINCTESPLNVSVHLSPVAGPQETKRSSSNAITLRRGILVYAERMGFIADPLVLVGEKPFRLGPGCITQLWMTVFDPSLKPGDYKVSLAVQASSQGRQLPLQTMSISIHIDPIRFPETPALNACCWAHPYSSYKIKENLPAAMRNLDSHHTNVLVVQHWRPLPQRVSKTGVITKPDYSRFDRLVKMSDYCKAIVLYLGFGPKRKYKGRFGKLLWMSPAWKRAFSDWLTDLSAHLSQIGVDHERFAIYPFDETLGDEFYDLARLIKSVDPRIRIFANSFGKGPEDFRRFKELIDIWCLQELYIDRHPEWLAEVKSFGKPVWTYEAQGPGKTNHPYSYYRLMPWRAFKRGLTGAGFWNYVEYYKTASWNDDRPKGYYSVVYLSYNSPVDTLGEEIIPSRRWQAWREGIEDYQYLYELQKRIALVKATDPAKAASAEELLGTQVDFVLDDQQDPARVYHARESINTALRLLLKQESRQEVTAAQAR
ncbi:MAG: hypothetical protein ACYST6_00605 [Planctomycetota bacterium]